jgi:hypothetical protein
MKNWMSFLYIFRVCQLSHNPKIPRVSRDRKSTGSTAGTEQAQHEVCGSQAIHPAPTFKAAARQSETISKPEAGNNSGDLLGSNKNEPAQWQQPNLADASARVEIPPITKLRKEVPWPFLNI